MPPVQWPTAQHLTYPDEGVPAGTRESAAVRWNGALLDPPGAGMRPGGAEKTVPQRERVSAAPTKNMRIAAGLIDMCAGLLIAISTFFAWVPSKTLGAKSGWYIMVESTYSGNFIFREGEGLSGFWSLLLGGLIILAGAILLFNLKLGGILSLIFGGMAVTAAFADIFTIYEAMDGSLGEPGLWLFAICSSIVFLVGAASVVIARQARRTGWA